MTCSDCRDGLDIVEITSPHSLVYVRDEDELLGLIQAYSDQEITDSSSSLSYDWTSIENAVKSRYLTYNKFSINSFKRDDLPYFMFKEDIKVYKPLTVIREHQVINIKINCCYYFIIHIADYRILLKLNIASIFTTLQL